MRVGGLARATCALFSYFPEHPVCDRRDRHWWHYLIDILAGAGLAQASIVLVKRLIADGEWSAASRRRCRRDVSHENRDRLRAAALARE